MYLAFFLVIEECVFPFLCQEKHEHGRLYKVGHLVIIIFALHIINDVSDIVSMFLHLESLIFFPHFLRGLWGIEKWIRMKMGN